MKKSPKFNLPLPTQLQPTLLSVLLITPKTLKTLPCLIWMVVIFYLSHQPGDQLGSKLQWWKQLAEQVPLVPPDKLAHFYMYFVLGALAYLARPKPLTLPLIFCPLYGLSDEIHQLFIPYRQFDWFDLLADAIGSTTAILVVAIWGYSRSNSSDPQKSKATPQV